MGGAAAGFLVAVASAVHELQVVAVEGLAAVGQFCHVVDDGAVWVLTAECLVDPLAAPGAVCFFGFDLGLHAFPWSAAAASASFGAVVHGGSGCGPGLLPGLHLFDPVGSGELLEAVVVALVECFPEDPAGFPEFVDLVSESADLAGFGFGHVAPWNGEGPPVRAGLGCRSVPTSPQPSDHGMWV